MKLTPTQHLVFNIVQSNPSGYIKSIKIAGLTGLRHKCVQTHLQEARRRLAKRPKGPQLLYLSGFNGGYKIKVPR